MKIEKGHFESINLYHNLRIAERSCIRVLTECERWCRAYSRVEIDFISLSRLDLDLAQGNFEMTAAGTCVSYYLKQYTWIIVAISNVYDSIDTLGSRTNNNKNRVYALGRCKNGETENIDDPWFLEAHQLEHTFYKSRCRLIYTMRPLYTTGPFYNYWRLSIVDYWRGKTWIYFNTKK